jgi:hypothetical protein
MKKIILGLLLPLVAVSAMLFTSCEIKKGTSEKLSAKTISADDTKAARKAWEATPDGMLYKQWEASAAGKKVFAGEAKISTAIKDQTNMEGVVTSLSLPTGSRLGFGVMVKINEEDYILSFGPEKAGDDEFKELHSLKVNDKIIIKSRGVSHAPKYAYPIVSGDLIEREGKTIYKRKPNKGGC